MKFFSFILFSFLLLSIFPVSIFAQEPKVEQRRLEAVIEKVAEEKEIDVFEKKQLYQKLELKVTDGFKKGETITVENGNFPAAQVIRYRVGDEVVVTVSQNPEGGTLFQISDYVRRTPLYILFGIFAVLTFLVGRLKGLTSLLGMGFSFLIIFVFILPQILAGGDPILISIIGALFMIPVTFYLSHGFNKKTTVAIIGTVLALVVTGILSQIFVTASNLTGFVSEEAGFLQLALGGAVNIKGLLLAGIIIGVLGVLDDVTVSQAAVVEQLKKANSSLKPAEIYKKAMSVGRDHIASMVNTLVLVYTGASMPLLLLFVNNPQPFTEVLNYEIIANEIIRTLVGSIGLILAVPIATFIAAVATVKEK